LPPTLTQIDCFIVLVFLFCVLALGLSLRSSIKTATDFFQAGRTLPTWLSAVALASAGLGAQELIATVAAGAQYGFAAAQFFVVASIPPLLFATLSVVPALVNSGARTVPEYLSQRFDRKTGLLNAYVFALATITGAGLSLYLMARLFQAIHVFDALFYSFGVPRTLVFSFIVLLASAVVLIYVLVSGLAASILNQAVQFLVIVAAFFPVAFIGIRNIGGFSALKAALPAAVSAHASRASLSLIALAAGLVLSAGYWCADFRTLQFAMAAKDAASARRIPLIAAAARLVIPLLLVLSGAIAISLPTPHSSTVVREENGAIIHEITVVPPDAAEGRGLVPARADATGAPLHDTTGQSLLDYDRTAPAMLMQLLPPGLLGLGIAALIAALMNSLAASATAFSAVFTFDLAKNALQIINDDRRTIKLGRWSSVVFMALAAGAAFAYNASGAIDFSFADALLLSFALVSAPQLATLLLGIFTRRTTARGAFAGLIAAVAVALLHYGLALPEGAKPGLHGGWIFPLISYPAFLAVCFWTAAVSFLANLLVTTAISSLGSGELNNEQNNLVQIKTRSKSKDRAPIVAWFKRPGTFAAAVLLIAVALSIYFF
jgi:SSS family solute:Na+ symporter